ncbi:hypothetical protein BpHYR1_046191 [Brachionus plicatilis]|uniref:Uncharacterized protein n=1 Tax=Brachionus plicatilis TaxID=10195 RepID=A0A3M7Q2W9_BRAPC|nr:hypothetical protein BpHYR1_046191 [Brachionus plicatilis]
MMIFKSELIDLVLAINFYAHHWVFILTCCMVVNQNSELEKQDFSTRIGKEQNKLDYLSSKYFQISDKLITLNSCILKLVPLWLIIDFDFKTSLIIIIYICDSKTSLRRWPARRSPMITYRKSWMSLKGSALKSPIMNIGIFLSLKNIHIDRVVSYEAFDSALCLLL